MGKKKNKRFILTTSLIIPYSCGGGGEYTDGVTKSSGVTTIEVTASTATSLYYYCSLHSGMGGSIIVTN